VSKIGVADEIFDLPRAQGRRSVLGTIGKGPQSFQIQTDGKAENVETTIQRIAPWLAAGNGDSYPDTQTKESAIIDSFENAARAGTEPHLSRAFTTVFTGFSSI
jgi:hypothetical protein